jgi:orc1/cdc6 family replication initiation protein
MSLFDDILKGDESIFKNPVALEFDYMPKEIPYRENEQHYIADCIKPLFMQRNGRNLLVFGGAGIGKSLAVKKIIEELSEKTDDIYPVYINCWQKNTSFKIMNEICKQIGYQFTHNKNTEELFEVAKKIINKSSAVFIFDEVDRCEDTDYLYYILEEIYKKTILLVTNFREWSANLDMRISSRLNLDLLEFRKYNENEVLGIIRRRIELAFNSGVFSEPAIRLISKKTSQEGDIRYALFLLLEAGNIAEKSSSRSVSEADVLSAIEKRKQFFLKPTDSLTESDKKIMEIIEENKKIKSGDAYKIFSDSGGQGTYKTFQRAVKKLEKDNFISTEKVSGGSEGKTTYLLPKAKKEKQHKL